MLFGVAIAFGLAGWLASGPAKWYLAVVAGGVIGVAVALWDTPPPYIENWRQGQEGERRTAKRLQRLPTDAWSVWHDLRSKSGGNLDHIVVGASGVFLLDSKNYLGEMSVDQGVLKIRWVEDPDDGWEAPRLVSGAKAASAELSERIGATCGTHPWVEPVVVLWGRFQQRVVEEDGVCFIHGEALGDWLDKRPVQFDHSTVLRLTHAVDTLASNPPTAPNRTSVGHAVAESEIGTSQNDVGPRGGPRVDQFYAIASVDDARAYINSVHWKYAKTMPQWPHEYTVRNWRRDLVPAFEGFAQLIRSEGVVKPWPRNAVVPRYRHHYLEIDGWEYWTMEEPVANTTVINRARLP